MAKAVDRALAERRHLIVEAGTGTGKTLAYLLPALRTGQRVMATPGLQRVRDAGQDPGHGLEHRALGPVARHRGQAHPDPVCLLEQEQEPVSILSAQQRVRVGDRLRIEHGGRRDRTRRGG